MVWSFLRSLFISKHIDQWAYEAAAKEIQSGYIREGLMLKAASRTEGDPAKTKALYLKFLAEQITEDVVKSKFERNTSLVAGQAIAAYDTSKKAGLSIAQALKRWGKAFTQNMGRGLVLSFILGLFLTYNATSKGRIGVWEFLFLNLSSGYFWGQLLVPTVCIALIIGLALVPLMCFPYFRRRNDLAFLITALPVFLFISSQWQGQEALNHYQTAAPTTSAYDKVLATYEQRYPQINPDSPFFDESVTTRVANQMNQYQRMGNSKENALALAVAEILQSTPISKPEVYTTTNYDEPKHSTADSKTSSPSCEYKSVMTDEDYRACGINH